MNKPADSLSAPRPARSPDGRPIVPDTAGMGKARAALNRELDGIEKRGSPPTHADLAKIVTLSHDAFALTTAARRTVEILAAALRLKDATA